MMMRFSKVTPEGAYVPPPPANAKASYATMLYVRADIVRNAGERGERCRLKRFLCVSACWAVGARVGARVATGEARRADIVRNVGERAALGDTNVCCFSLQPVDLGLP
jgi:hypothetical protein